MSSPARAHVKWFCYQASRERRKTRPPQPDQRQIKANWELRLQSKPLLRSVGQRHVHLTVPRPSASTSRFTPTHVDIGTAAACGRESVTFQERRMAKIAKTADRKKVMDTTKSTDCPKCGKPTRVVKRVKDRERNIAGGMYISCSACEFYEKL